MLELRPSLDYAALAIPESTAQGFTHSMDTSASLDRAAHRPWPLPEGPWRIAMRWHDLLFMHWPVAAAPLERLLPSGLQLDTRDGQAWLGIVPFRMTGVRHRLMPALPWLSAFPELNVRTYVTAGGKPGVWFFSLDAANPIAVRIARRTYHLAYYRARMSMARAGDEVRYQSRRMHRGVVAAEFVGRYHPVGGAFAARPGTLEHWLTERYCLYAADPQGRAFRAEIHHAPWPLQPAEAVVERNTMARPLDIDLPDVAPLLHFAARLDVVAWAPQRV